MTDLGSFSLNGTVPATGQVGYFGNAVAFVPAGADSINQDTLVITWAQTDPMNPSRRLHLFHRITIVPNNGTPAILATATIPSDLSVAGGTFGINSLVKDLVYDAASRKLVGVMSVNGQRVFAFDLFSTNVTVSSLIYSAITGDAQVPNELLFQGASGDYTSCYTTSGTNWRKISIGRTQLNGTTAFSKVDVAKTSFTGWYPDPAPYPVRRRRLLRTGGASFYGSTVLLMRCLQELPERQCPGVPPLPGGQHVWTRRRSMPCTDLGAVPTLTGSYIGYGMTFDKIGGMAYVRSGYTNDSGSGTYNKIFMARLAVEASPIAPDAVSRPGGRQVPSSGP